MPLSWLCVAAFRGMSMCDMFIEAPAAKRPAPRTTGGARGGGFLAFALL